VWYNDGQEDAMVARMLNVDDEESVIFHSEDVVAPARYCLSGRDEIDG
jgi:hypothetical protein